MSIIKRSPVIVCGLTAIWLVSFIPGKADAAAYVKFEGISGESKDKDHKNWSDLVSFSQELASAKGDGRRRAEASTVSFEITKDLDKASPKLAEALLKGTVIPWVTIHVTSSSTNAGRVVYFDYRLKNVRITKYQVSGPGEPGSRPREAIAISYEKIEVTYTELDQTGKTKGKTGYSWNH